MRMTFVVPVCAVSVPAALVSLKSFGQISGNKSNLDKSETFPINTTIKNILYIIFALELFIMASLMLEFGLHINIKIHSK